MASPQVENGYTKIANELLEALAKIRIPGEARQVLDVICRRTYGFNKKYDAISLSQFNLATGLKKVAVCKAIQKLTFLNLITQKGNDTSKTYSINKDFETWKPLPKKVTLPKKVINVTQKGNNHYPKRVPQNKKEKRNICDSEKSPSLSSEKPKSNGKDHRVKALIGHFFSLCKEKLDREPTIEGKKDGPAIKRALQKFDEEQIKNLFDFYVDSPKAHNNGLSIAVALSNHSISEYEQKGRWRYEG